MNTPTKKPQGDRLIDDSLRRVFGKTLDEDVPDRFRDLLDQLRAQDEDATQADATQGDPSQKVTPDE